jgi:hypothetical protein
MKLASACDFVRAVTPVGAEGNVHLVAKEELVVGAGRNASRREAGEFMCSAAYGRNVRNTQPSDFGEFRTEPCPKCVEQAEKFGVVVGDLWQDVPGPRVPLYTTSPERRDRPYVGPAKTVGTFKGSEVRRVMVPESMADANRQWYKRDQYHCWSEETWNVMVRAGRAKERE